MTVSLNDLTAEQRLALFAELVAVQDALKEARKARREERRAWLPDFVTLVQDDFPEPDVFESGAVGWSISGSKIPVVQADGTTREARVNLLIRWEDTIPAPTKGAKESDTDKVKE